MSACRVSFNGEPEKLDLEEVNNCNSQVNKNGIFNSARNEATTALDPCHMFKASIKLLGKTFSLILVENMPVYIDSIPANLTGKME